MTDIDARRRQIMRHLDERYYAYWARKRIPRTTKGTAE